MVTNPSEAATETPALAQATLTADEEAGTIDQQDNEGKKRKTRQRSPFLFPAYNLGTAIDVAKRVDEGGAGTLSEDVLAVNMGLSVKSSGFQVKCLTARQFGLLTKQSENLTTTPIAKSILHPTSPDDAANGLRQAFSRMPLFQAVADRFKGQPLPLGEMFRNILEREFRISRGRVADAERMLRDSAREAKVLTISGDKEYLTVTGIATLPQVQQPGETPQEQAAQQRDQQPTGDHVIQANSTIIILASGGEVRLTLKVDLFTLSARDREFILGLVDHVQKYKPTE